MPRGGARPGAGRKKAEGKKSSPAKKIKRAETVLASTEHDSQQFDTALEYLRSVWNDASEDTKFKIQAATAALPYQNQKLAEDRLGKKDMARQNAKNAVSGGSKFAPRPPPKLIANNGSLIGKK